MGGSYNLASVMFMVISTYLFIIYHPCAVTNAEIAEAPRYARSGFPNRDGHYHRASKTAADTYLNDIMSDDPIFGMSKRQTSDDYGHLRFGKRNEQFDDYGHMRFGRND